MNTVGKKIIPLDEFSAFISTLSAAITLHFVSTSQAVVGGVTGVGLVKGLRTVRKRTLIQVAAGWVFTPLLCGVIAYFMMKIYLIFSGAGA